MPLEALIIVLCLCFAADYTAAVTKGKAALPIKYTGCSDEPYAIELTLDGVGPIKAILDSGSSNFAVAATSCSSCDTSPSIPVNTGTGHNYFNIEYGTGEIEVVEVEKQLAFLGSGTSKPLSFSALSVGAILTNEVAGGIEAESFFHTSGPCRDSYQGIWGMAFRRLAQGGVTPLFDQLVNLGTPNAFSITLCPDLSPKDTLIGQLLLGGGSTKLMNPGHNLSYVDIVEDLWYVVHVEGFNVAGQQVPFVEDLNRNQQTGLNPSAIVDTGTTDLFLNSLCNTAALAIAISDGLSLNTQEKWFIPECGVTLPGPKCFWMSTCNQPGHIDPITIQLQLANGVALDVPIERIFGSSSNIISQIGIAFLQAEQYSNTIIGQTVLRGKQIVFDKQGQKVGFAPADEVTCRQTVNSSDIDIAPTAAPPQDHHVAGSTIVLLVGGGAFVILVVGTIIYFCAQPNRVRYTEFYQEDYDTPTMSRASFAQPSVYRPMHAPPNYVPPVGHGQTNYVLMEDAHNDL